MHEGAAAKLPRHYLASVQGREHREQPPGMPEPTVKDAEGSEIYELESGIGQRDSIEQYFSDTFIH